MRASTVFGTLAAAGSALAVGYLVDRQFGPPRPETGTRFDGLRRFNRNITTPLLLRAADLNPSLPSPAIVGHVGRTSGRAYRTPVTAAPVADGFVIALPYGREVDWCRNLVAAGGGTLRHHGATVRVTDPVYLDRAEALAAVDGPLREVWSRLGLTDYLRLTRAADPPAAA